MLCSECFGMFTWTCTVALCPSQTVGSTQVQIISRGACLFFLPGLFLKCGLSLFKHDFEHLFLAINRHYFCPPGPRPEGTFKHSHTEKCTQADLTRAGIRNQILNTVSTNRTLPDNLEINPLFHLGCVVFIKTNTLQPQCFKLFIGTFLGSRSQETK